MSRSLETEKSECQARIDKELLEAKRNAFGAIESGMETMVSLEAQDETLKSVEDTLEANEHALSKAMKTMTGMTWSGFLYNQCVNTRELVLGATANPPATSTGRTNSIPTNQGSKVSASQSHLTTNQLISNENEKEKDDLDEISSAVATLHQMSLDIGEQIDNHNTTIEKISEKTDKVTEQTLAVTIRASQLSNRTNNRKPKIVGMVQFIDIITGKYLSASNNRLILQQRMDRSTYFMCFMKESHLYGFRNEKTLKFIGCAMLGHIIAENEYFGTQEECYIDINAKTTGILFIARHWGAGGWLKRPLTDPIMTYDHPSNITSSTSNGTSKTIPSIPTPSTSTSPPVPPAGTTEIHPYLTETTSGITDKTGRIEFRINKLHPKEILVED